MEEQICQEVSVELWINEYESSGNCIFQAENEVIFNEKLLKCFLC